MSKLYISSEVEREEEKGYRLLHQRAMAARLRLKVSRLHLPLSFLFLQQETTDLCFEDISSHEAKNSHKRWTWSIQSGG